LPVLDSNEDFRNQTPASYQLDEQAVFILRGRSGCARRHRSGRSSCSSA
jgi:hypothetical protein